MTLMDQGWAAVIAAGVAAVVALFGAFIGVWVGRRTVRDQAHVEHGQWLRGQRQETYVVFLAAWDQAQAKFSDFVGRLGEWHTFPGGTLDEVTDLASEELHATVEGIRRAAEPLHLVGPDEVDQRVFAMLAAAEEVSVAIAHNFPLDGEVSTSQLQLYWTARDKADEERAPSWLRLGT
ncbi:hypothetical protein [Streptomyces sp. NPDC054975]